ncbi:cupin domain-containing protein [Paraburkholderia tropica]|uniref:cupin domain-containing protein n=1 Tax=Paraburkholderia tropica TaxID=92647 RepID=UPI002AAF8E16|nr:cupin domain-containing protein [Paraburkholderia tropica]
MKVTSIKNSAHFLDLEDRGSIASLSGPDIELRGIRQSVDGAEVTNTGIFECTAGSYRRIVMEPEVMHILQGHGRFTPDGEAPVEFSPGDTLFFAANTQGLWEMPEPMRKFYVIL